MIKDIKYEVQQTNLVTLSTSWSRRSNGSSHTTDTIFTRGTISTLCTLVTLRGETV